MIQQKLLHAEKTALQLFEAIEENNWIVPGKTEEQLNTEVYMLASWKFGIEKHWHKRIVRSGSNTLAVYNDNPPDRKLQDDDIVFIDYGPIVEGCEADVARTFVIGNNAVKRKLKNDVERAWYETREWYQKQTSLKASDLFQYVVDKARDYGWEFGGEIAGHIVGKFPHEQPLDPASLELDIHPSNHNDMFLPDANGNKRQWILEIHFVDKKNKIGGYFEQML
jgi:Xaa-Pro aminopeptidase